MIPNPWMILGALVVVAGLVLSAFFYGRQTGEDHVRAGELATEQAAVKQLQEENVAVNAKAAKLEELRSQQNASTRIIEKTVQKIVTRPIYAGDCFDADGVQLVNSAAGLAPADPGQFGSKVPATPAP